MKGSKLIFALSLAGNVILLGAILFWPSARQGGSEVAADSPTAPISNSAAAPLKPKLASGAAAATAKGTWEQLGRGDLPALVARLRAAGFPPAMLRAAVSAWVDERFAARRRALEAASEKSFWKGRDEADPQTKTALMVLDHERRKLIQQLLGAEVDVNDENVRAITRQEIGRDLPPEKIAQLFKVKSDFGDRIYAELARVGSGAQLPEDRAKLQQLQNEMHGELAKIFSPEELLEYDLRNSNTAGLLRYELSSIRPTEAEFRVLFPLYRELDEKYPLKMSGVNTEEDIAPRNAALAQLKDQIKTLLGPERFAEYELSRSYDYQQTAKLTERLNLPATATGEVYAVQKEIQQRALQFRGNRTLSAEDRTAQLAALASEASAKISTVLGPDGLEAYKQYGGQWLQQLTPRPRANAKVP
jgi:hypothetical protein